MPRKTELSMDWAISLLLFQLEIKKKNWFEKTPFLLFLRKLANFYKKKKHKFTFQQLHELFEEEAFISKTNFANYLNKMLSIGILRKEKRDEYYIEPYLLIILNGLEEQIVKFETFNILQDADLASVPDKFLQKFTSFYFHLLKKKNFVFSMVEEVFEKTRNILFISMQDIMYYSHPFEKTLDNISQEKGVIVKVMIYSKNNFDLLKTFGPKPKIEMVTKENFIVRLNTSRRLNYNCLISDEKNLYLSFPYKSEPLQVPNYFLFTNYRTFVKVFVTDFNEYLKYKHY